MDKESQTTEQDWLDAVENVFQYAKKQNPPVIGRSEIESLIIGLRSLAKSPKGIQVLNMLNTYLATMKKKNKKFLPITFLVP
jgi:hypothetical protein